MWMLLPRQYGYKEGVGRLILELWVERNTKVPSKKLQDYVIHTVEKKKSSFARPPASSKSSSTPYPITHYVSCNKFSDNKHCRDVVVITVGNPPKSF